MLNLGVASIVFAVISLLPIPIVSGVSWFAAVGMGLVACLDRDTRLLGIIGLLIAVLPAGVIFLLASQEQPV